MQIGYSAKDAACRTRAAISSASEDVAAARIEPASTTARTTSNTCFLR